MRFLDLASIAVLLVATSGLFLPHPSRAESEAQSKDPAEVSAEFRAKLLRGTAAQFSIEPVADVWGVLMEIGYPDAAATVVGLGDGTASLYFSSGGGIIGGGPHPSINAAARRLVEISGRHRSELSPAKEFPLPQPGDVTFYVLTTQGVLRGGATEAALGSGKHPLSEMFFAGHDVITGIRKVTEERRQ